MYSDSQNPTQSRPFLLSWFWILSYHSSPHQLFLHSYPASDCFWNTYAYLKQDPIFVYFSSKTSSHEWIDLNPFCKISSLAFSLHPLFSLQLISAWNYIIYLPVWLVIVAFLYYKVSSMYLVSLFFLFTIASGT